MNTAPLHCPHCAAPLDALTRRRGQAHCGAAACRQRADAAVLAARWQQVAAQAVQQAVALQPARRSRPPAVLWLRPAMRELEPVTDELRATLAAAWRTAVAEDRRRSYDGADSAAALPDAATVLCAQCAGACCVHGGGNHAFIDADVIERWQAAHPGGSVEDAIADYLSRLPAEHVRGACAYQTPSGCAQAREWRADICNGYVCAPLQALGQALADDPRHAVVALTADGRQLERAALVAGGRLHALVGLPSPDDLPR